MFNTAISYLFYNRPHCVKITFPTLQKLKPKKLYLVADGPKSKRDVTLCKQSREIVESLVNWDCEIIKLYSENNLGLAHRTVSALNNIFEHEEELIFVEDDNFADLSFFYFCESLLKKYKYEKSIYHIGGCNYFEKAVDRTKPFDYIFSGRMSAWGFATWKRAWSQMDLSMKNWVNEDKDKFLHKWCLTSKQKKLTRKIFDQHCMNPDPWAWSYAWIYACWSNDGLCITPTKNLISNIGFSSSATNTKMANRDIVYIPEKRNVISTLNHPSDIYRDYQFEKKSIKLENTSLIRRMWNKLKSVLFNDV
jgi:hypothetical protein